MRPCLTIRPTSTRSRFTRAGRAALAVTAIGLALTPTAASASPTQGGETPAVLALGDSYGAGEGLPANWPKDTNRPCNRSTVAWPSLAQRVATNVNADLGGSIRWNGDAKAILAQRGAKTTAKPLTYEACSGATFATTDYDGNAYKNTAQQLATQVTGKNKFQMVTLSMGGNDLGFVPIIKDCIIDYGLKTAEGTVKGWSAAPNLWYAIAQGLVTAETSASCQQDWSKVQEDSNSILNDMEVGLDAGNSKMSLSQVYEWILSNKVEPGGTLTITTYPNMFADPADWPAFHLGRCGAISMTDARGIRATTDIANQRIIAAAAAAEAAVPGSSVEVVRQDELFEGHELCGQDGEWLYGMRSIVTHTINSCSGTGAYFGFRMERAFHPTCDAHQVTGATVGVLMANALQNTTAPSQAGGTAPPVRDPELGPADTTAPATRDVAAYCRALENRQSEILDRYNQGRTRTQQAEDLEEIFSAGADQIGTFLDDLDRYLELAADNAPPDIEDITGVLSNEIDAGDGGFLAAAEFFLDYLMLSEQIAIVDGYTRDACGFGF